MFNARNEHDRTKFCEDLREAILEMDEMESLRIEGELDKQQRNASARLSRPPAAPSAATPPPPAGSLKQLYKEIHFNSNNLNGSWPF